MGITELGLFLFEFVTCTKTNCWQYYLVKFLEKLLTWMWILHTSFKPLIMMKLLSKTCNWYIYLDKWSHESHHQTCPKKKKIHKQKNCLICFLFHIWLLVLEQGKHICSSSNCSSLTSTPKSFPLHNQDIAYSNLLETKQKRKAVILTSSSANWCDTIV